MRTVAWRPSSSKTLTRSAGEGGSGVSAEPPPPFLLPHPQGVRLLVRVQPGARRDGIVGLHGERLKVRVSAPALDGRANRSVCKLIAESLGRAARDVSVEAGPRSRDKTLVIQGMSVVAAATILARHLAD